MKRVLWLLAAGFLITDLAFADTYVKAAGMNGMGVNETWYSGKKKREVSHVDLGGGITRDEIVITRVDKNVEWTLDVDLKMYRERPIFIPDTPGDSIPADVKAKPNEKWVDLPKEEKDYCDPELVTLPEKATLAGFTATGYQAVCKQRDQVGAPRMTMWLSPATGALAQYDKDLKAYEKAYRDVMYKELTAAERKTVEEFFGAFGEAAGSMLLGLRIDKLPKGVPLKMEQVGANMADGSVGNAVLYETLEVRSEKADPSLFELPSGYSKITNEDAYAEKEMQVMADKMGMGDAFRNQMAANKAYSTMLPPESGMSPPEPPAVVAEAASESDEPAAHVPVPPPPQVQEDTTNEDFDARDYAS